MSIPLAYFSTNDIDIYGKSNYSDFEHKTIVRNFITDLQNNCNIDCSLSSVIKSDEYRKDYGYYVLYINDYNKHVLGHWTNIPKECTKYQSFTAYITSNTKQNKNTNYEPVQDQLSGQSSDRRESDVKRGNSIQVRRSKLTVEIGHLSNKTISV